MARKPSAARSPRICASLAMQRLAKFDLPEQSAFSQALLTNRTLPFCCGGARATRRRAYLVGAAIEANREKSRPLPLAALQVRRGRTKGIVGQVSIHPSSPPPPISGRPSPACHNGAISLLLPIFVDAPAHIPHCSWHRKRSRR